MPYWRLLYHLVWATYRREPSITPQREAFLHRILRGKAFEIEVFVHGLGNAEDHLHMVVGIPPKLAVSECIRQLKGASSHALNHSGNAGLFRWQEGYGAVTLTDEILPTVTAYAENQKEHHRTEQIIEHYERCSAEEDPFP